MEYLGNKEILNNYKIGFPCSRKVPADIILKTYYWAIKLRNDGKCVISGFHSKIEKDVFDILLKGSQPIIIVLARGSKKRWSKEITEQIKNNRLLIISPFNEKVKRNNSVQAKKRNELIVSLSDKVFIPFVKNDGSIYELVRSIKPEKLINNFD